MKKLIYLLIIPVIFFACEDEDEIRLPDIQDGVTMRIQVDPNNGFLNFADLSNSEIIFSLFTVNDNVETVELYVEYYNFGQDSTYDRTLWRTFQGSEFDNEGAIRDISFATQDLLDLYSIASADTISGGDVITFHNITTLEGGRVYPDTVLTGTDYEAVNIDPGQTYGTTSSFSPGFVAYVACPSDPADWEGDYLTSLTGVDNFCGLLDCSSTRVVTVSRNYSPEPFKYSVTSHDAGLWGSFDPGSLDRAGNFYDICGSALLLPSPTGYGDHEGTGFGPRDPDTGEFSLPWCNFFNPVCGTTIFTPID